MWSRSFSLFCFLGVLFPAFVCVQRMSFPVWVPCNVCQTEQEVWGEWTEVGDLNAGPTAVRPIAECLSRVLDKGLALSLLVFCCCSWKGLWPNLSSKIRLFPPPPSTLSDCHGVQCEVGYVQHVFFCYPQQEIMRKNTKVIGHLCFVCCVSAWPDVEVAWWKSWVQETLCEQGQGEDYKSWHADSVCAWGESCTLSARKIKLLIRRHFLIFPHIKMLMFLACSFPEDKGKCFSLLEVQQPTASECKVWCHIFHFRNRPWPWGYLLSIICSLELLR